MYKHILALLFLLMVGFFPDSSMATELKPWHSYDLNTFQLQPPLAPPTLQDTMTSLDVLQSTTTTTARSITRRKLTGEFHINGGLLRGATRGRYVVHDATTGKIVEEGGYGAGPITHYNRRARTKGWVGINPTAPPLGNHLLRRNTVVRTEMYGYPKFDSKSIYESMKRKFGPR